MVHKSYANRNGYISRTISVGLYPKGCRAISKGVVAVLCSHFCCLHKDAFIKKPTLNNMLDITKESKPFAWKEFAVNTLIAVMPASVLIVIINQIMGVTGAVVPLLCIFGGEMIVAKIRRKRGSVATKKTVLYVLLANLIFFIVLPMIFIAFTA